MSENAVSRRGLFKGAGLGLIAGIAGSHLLRSEKVCLNEALPDDSPLSRIATRELIETLNDYDQQYLEQGFMPATDLDIAEGERYLTHLFRVGCELFMEGHADHPQFQKIVTPTMKLMGDNADAFYFHTQINSNRRYRIRGKLTGEVYLSLTVYTGEQPGSWSTGVATALNSRQFDIAEDGSFEIIAGPNEVGRNRLQLSSDSLEIITRHYFMNDSYAACDPMVSPLISIENLDPVAPPAAPSDQSTSDALHALNRFIRANSIERPLMNPLDTPDWFSLTPNTLGQPQKWNPASDAGGWGAVDNAYSAGRFDLQADEALIIEGRMPQCVFANVLLWNRYLQTFDYRYRQVSLNKKQLKQNPDGSFKIVLSHQDPGVDNWLDTEGRQTGIVYWRFLLAEGELASITTTKIKFAELTS